MAAKDLLLTLLINLIWGLNVVVAKYGVGQIPPILFTFLRFAIVAAVLLPVLKIHKGQMRAVIFVAVATGGIHFALIYTGLALAADISSVAIAMQLGIPFATVLSMLFLGEKIRFWRWLGLSMAFGGILLISFDPQVFAYRNALALVVLGSLFGASGLLVAKKLTGVGVFELQSWIAMISWPLLLGMSLAFEPGQFAMLLQADLSVWGAVLYTALAASVLAHSGMYYLIQRYDLSLVMPTFLLATVFAVIFGVTLLGDQLTPRMIAGGSCTLLGVLLILLRQVRKPRAATPPAAT
ncbi:MAG: DMT family transporter [Gammaproteobacteria bacterium]|nr:DMT family transporter [Gammaproteobacteria bacterium]MCZ6762342.1 DMT family transporter [Gammaproteobacteria bacterium]